MMNTTMSFYLNHLSSMCMSNILPQASVIILCHTRHHNYYCVSYTIGIVHYIKSDICQIFYIQTVHSKY